ncbi:hypothetical protein UY3_06495 [Chelonia mydas]|uniref:Uncharacterized protein n=1 Tax=Chelonia mydas TaxID=8469 RepID=M7C709_CHEMY|nr:hypothetical protein UY3_06495 [Chelonia mydas]
MALPVNKPLMELAKNIWQTLATIPLTCKRADKKYYISSKGMDFLFSYPAPNLLVVDTISEQGRQHHSRSTPYDKEWKWLALFGCKAYSSDAFQFLIPIYAALMVKYDYINYSKLSDFIEHIPEDKREQFKEIIVEGHLLARTALQASLNAADMAECSPATAIVMCPASWLHLSSSPREVQSTVEDLPFNCQKLFAVKPNKSLHTLKASRATLRSLVIFTPAQRKKTEILFDPVCKICSICPTTETI